MPTRSYAQQIGDIGQALVESWFEHPRWVARKQSHDFGIDLEAELAVPIEDRKQQMTGKLIKLQIKSSAKIERGAVHIAYPVPRELIHYADAFRLPVILAVACIETKTVWWLWLQEWSMLNEVRLGRHPDTATITAHIPLAQTLERDIATGLPEIALGSAANAMILGLRNMIEAAGGWQNQPVAEGVARLLGKVHGESRGWALQKVADKLLSMSKQTPFWEAQQVLPIMNGLIDVGGDSFTRDQVIGLVARGDTYSRTGLLALSRLYDLWPEQMRALKLIDGFAEAKLGQLVWYCVMRERYPMGAAACFGISLIAIEHADLRYGKYLLTPDYDTREYIMSKWPNRGDSVLLDCLTLEDPLEDEVRIPTGPTAR